MHGGQAEKQAGFLNVFGDNKIVTVGCYLRGSYHPEVDVVLLQYVCEREMG